MQSGVYKSSQNAKIGKDMHKQAMNFKTVKILIYNLHKIRAAESIVT